MKPPLARSIFLRFSLLLTLAASTLFVLFSPRIADAADAPLFAADAGRHAASALGPVELAALIALGFLPALYMIARARQAR